MPTASRVFFKIDYFDESLTLPLPGSGRSVGHQARDHDHAGRRVLTAAFQHVVRPTLGNRLNPQSEKGTALLSAVKPAESGFADRSAERRDLRGAQRCDPAPILMEQTDEPQNAYSDGPWSLWLAEAPMARKSVSGFAEAGAAMAQQLDDNDLLNLFSAVGRVVSKRFLTEAAVASTGGNSSLRSWLRRLPPLGHGVSQNPSGEARRLHPLRMSCAGCALPEGPAPKKRAQNDNLCDGNHSIPACFVVQKHCKYP